ncbi:centrosome and spindle pole-associated protein 1 [Nematolebias whitei]|uniref:centrosome and spindle pole-associated protein 1 n=1 Tax=Nematolebias whitei TaxID=451745 RepID=UPI0018983BB3|nr:centrosome and spindle pole-associated protein 1 [Nematolebias whitei]
MHQEPPGQGRRMHHPKTPTTYPPRPEIPGSSRDPSPGATLPQNPEPAPTPPRSSQATRPVTCAHWYRPPRGLHAANRGLGLILQLGRDYEKKKHKLLQELQLDYKDGAAKKINVKPHESHSHHQGLSLPITERASIKERLREERNKEYNLFLQEQAQKRGLKRGTSPVTSKLEHFQASDVVNLTSQCPPLPILNTQTNTPPPPHKDCPAFRRDAATLTEAGDTEKNTRILDPPRRRRWQIHKPRELYSSEEELCTDEEEDFDFRRRRRPDRDTHEPQYHKKRRSQKSRLDRTVEDMKEMEGSVLSDQNNKDGVLESDSKQIPDSMRIAATSSPVTSKDKTESATGLMIGGTEDQTKIQMKKEQYRQELLKQIAEQQGNKLKEKKLELKVAATGATDPEKEPDRIKQLRMANQHLRQDAPHKSGIDLETIGMDPNPRPRDENTQYRALRGNSLTDINTTLSQLPGRTMPGPGMRLEQDASPFDFIHEDYHNNITRTPGEVALPRITSVAPRLPPMVPNKPPYDSAPYCHSTRNPLEVQDNLHGGVQQFRNFETPPLWPLPVKAYEDPPFATEGLHANLSQQRRESILRYQEALKQQIQEREERKQREKEEKERSDAKSEAEMMTYDPWGRSGGGAPIKDQYGNLVSDLKQMHIINQNRMFSPRGGAGSPLSHQLSGSSHDPPPQQPPIQDRYKEELKQQIEENRRKRVEEQERQRMAVEQEEERLKKERARILQQYEEEQRRQKEAQVKEFAKKKRRVHEVLVQHAKEVKNTKQRKHLVPQSDKEREENTSQFTVQRQPSPPIPTLQKKHKSPAASKPTSERSVSAPYVQPAPRHIPTHQKGQREVIEGLSALRNYLKKEQRQVEQLGLTDTYPPHLGRSRTNAFEAANKQSAHPLTRSPASAIAERQNDQLKNGVSGLKDTNSPSYFQLISALCLRRKPVCFVPRNASLPFEKAFTGDGQVDQQGEPQPSERRERTASQRKQVRQAVADFLDEREQNDLPSNSFLRSHKLTDNRRRDSKSDRTGLKRPVSVGTVATELWTPREHQNM